MPANKRPKSGGVYELFKEEENAWVCQVIVDKDEEKICGEKTTKGAAKGGDKGRNNY